ncbi:MAG TPA: arsinothricin resistance N-acetyltransferase ArsN1 family B [Herpetosiphonaceae bacterium]|nr:arsinothricin resistance N-acetyltransferase ArsN1 family B [Herpetosiphonaceae bacterium]
MSFTLRLADPADAADIHAIYAPVVVETAISFEHEPPTVAEMAARIAATLKQHPWLVCVSGDAVIGYAYASAHRARAAYQWAAEVSAYIHPDWRGRRVGQALYTALLGVLRRQGYYLASAGVALPNPASVRLHESCGFERLGVYRQIGFKLGAWHDVSRWQRELQPRAADPAPPTPLTGLDGADLAPIFESAARIVRG